MTDIDRGMEKAPKSIDPRNSDIKIDAGGFEQIEVAGGVKLSDALRADVEVALNNYVSHWRWDQLSRPSTPRKRAKKKLRRSLEGALEVLEHVRATFIDADAFDHGIALEMQCLPWRAGIDPMPFLKQVDAILAVIREEEDHPKQGGRPADLFLPELFCELEKVFIEAGGTRLGVTKSIDEDGERISPFADFVSAILRFAPSGIGPTSSQAVAVAWERQLKKRGVFQRAVSAPNPVSAS